MKVIQGKVVEISYKDLSPENNDAKSSHHSKLMDKVHRAFGSDDDCLGIVAITDVPSFAKLRSKLLPLSYRLACTLSEKELDDVTVESACYSVGWSCGKEKVEGDKYDTSKGSFYANPITDDLLQSTVQRSKGGLELKNPFQQLPCTEEELIIIAAKNPAFFAPNVWPSQSLQELEPTFKQLGLLIREVGLKVANLCDAYVSMKVGQKNCTYIIFLWYRMVNFNIIEK